jgi:hypothetical protein
MHGPLNVKFFELSSQCIFIVTCYFVRLWETLGLCAGIILKLILKGGM